MLFAFYATTQITSIDAAARFLIDCGAGLGMVLILRWYWWRINAWSEIAATIAPFFAYSFCKFWLEEHLGSDFVLNNGTLFVTVGFTTLVWVIVTFLTPPTAESTLSKFYNLVKPLGAWSQFRNADESSPDEGKIMWLVFSWISAIIMTYSTLFLTGKLILQEWDDSIAWGVVATASFLCFKMIVKKSKILVDFL